MTSDSYPANPILVRVRRGGTTESVHRGAWCVVDASGALLDGAGDWEHPYFVRSAIKVVQALPLLESGAADRIALRDDELALAMASHSGEACHTEVVAGVLARLGLDARALRCGVHPPNDPGVRAELRDRGDKPTALHNNCSGKHAGFLALAQELGVAPADYLDPASAGQREVRAALGALADVDADALAAGVDGCSAPTYAMPLRALATAFARVANPGDLPPSRRAHLERMTGVARAHPVLIAGSHKRIDTDLIRVTDGRLFPKIGAEAVHAIGVRGADRALAIKVDDGALRGLHAVVLGLLERLGWIDDDEARALERWRDPVLRNHAGLDVGRVEVCL